MGGNGSKELGILDDDSSKIVKINQKFGAHGKYRIKPTEYEEIADFHRRLRKKEKTVTVDKLLKKCGLTENRVAREVFSMLADDHHTGEMVLAEEEFVMMMWMSCPETPGEYYYSYAFPFKEEDEVEGNIHLEYANVRNFLSEALLHEEIIVQKKESADKRKSTAGDKRGSTAVTLVFDEDKKRKARAEACSFVQRHHKLFMFAFKVADQLRYEVVGRRFWKSCSKRLLKKDNGMPIMAEYSNWRLATLIKAQNGHKLHHALVKLATPDLPPENQPEQDESAKRNKKELRKLQSFNHTVSGGSKTSRGVERSSDLESDPRLRPATSDPRIRRRAHRSTIAVENSSLESVSFGEPESDTNSAMPLVCTFVKHPAYTSDYRVAKVIGSLSDSYSEDLPGSSYARTARKQSPKETFRTKMPPISQLEERAGSFQASPKASQRAQTAPTENVRSSVMITANSRKSVMPVNSRGSLMVASNSRNSNKSTSISELTTPVALHVRQMKEMRDSQRTD